MTAVDTQELPGAQQWEHRGPGCHGALGHQRLPRGYAGVEQGAGGAAAPKPGVGGVQEGRLVVHDGGAGGGHGGEAAAPGPAILSRCI